MANKDLKQVPVPVDLHRALKAEAQRDGRKLYALVGDVLKLGLRERARNHSCANGHAAGF